jgi:hypothetical protein
MLLFALAVTIMGIAAFTIMTVKDRTYVPSAAYLPMGEPNRKVAVVYYSRSGHSEAVAREIARTLNAPIARIDADYPLNSAGQGKAIFDAGAEALPNKRGGRFQMIAVCPLLAEFFRLEISIQCPCLTIKWS